MSLNINKLDNIRCESGNRIRAACPACRTIGRDNHGDNLSVWENGAYHCWSYPDDTDHRKRIFELVGEKSGKAKSWPDPIKVNAKSLSGTAGTGKFYSNTNRVNKGKKIFIPPIFTNKIKTPVPRVPTEEIEENIDKLSKPSPQLIYNLPVNNIPKRTPPPVMSLSGICHVCWHRNIRAVPIKEGEPCFNCGCVN